jgi:hypothetical protein
MVLEEFWMWIETRPLAAHIGETAWFPFLESVHVLTAMFVVGTVLMADLRLLGWAARRYPVTIVTREVVPWTWGAFAIASLTGLGLFITRASSYVANPAFQVKVLLLLLAGANMLVLNFVAFRSVEHWNLQATTSRAARFAGGCSLVVWAGVVLAGRWIGHLS